MATIIGVRFHNAGKLYYFEPGQLWPTAGDAVIVETARGLEYGEVVTGVHEVPDEEITPPLKPVVRIATVEDAQRQQENRRKEKEAYAICQKKIIEHKLEMKLVSVEYTFDGSKILFYFTANGRVDFRALVKNLAAVFKTRIELKQIGVRDEAKMLGGLGLCGRPVCCAQFMGDFQPVSIKMAKEQNLSLSPTKISGLCGRLMCCLQYEESCYEQMHKLMPKTGKEIETPDGVGIAVENNVITEKTKVKLTAEDGTIDIREYPYQDLGPGAKERAMERAAQAAAEPETEKAEGFTPLRQGSQLRQNRGRDRQPQPKGDKLQPKGDKSQPKGDKPQPKAEKQPKGENKPQNKSDKPQPKGDRPKGDKNQGQNRNKGNRDNKQSKPAEQTPKAEAPAGKVQPEVAAAPPAPEAAKATVPFSRNRRSRRHSFGPKKV